MMLGKFGSMSIGVIFGTFFSRNPFKKTSMFSKEELNMFVVKNVLRIYSQICMICNATFNVYNMCIVKDIIRETNVRIRY